MWKPLLCDSKINYCNSQKLYYNMDANFLGRPLFLHIRPVTSRMWIVSERGHSVLCCRSWLKLRSICTLITHIHEPNECYTSHTKSCYSLKTALAPTERSLSVPAKLFYEYDTWTDTFFVSPLSSRIFFPTCFTIADAFAYACAVPYMNTMLREPFEIPSQIHSLVIKSFTEME